MGTTKADIIYNVHAKLPGFTKKETAEFVDATLEVMKDTLQTGGTQRRARRSRSRLAASSHSSPARSSRRRSTLARRSRNSEVSQLLRERRS